MPYKGWKTIPIKEEYYNQLEALAKADGRTIGNFVMEVLFEKRILKRNLKERKE